MASQTRKGTPADPTPADPTPADPTPADPTPAEITAAENAAAADALSSDTADTAAIPADPTPAVDPSDPRTILADDARTSRLASYDPAGAEWPEVLPIGPTMFGLQARKADHPGASLYSTGAISAQTGKRPGLFGTADKAQHRADAAHAKSETVPAVSYFVAMVGGSDPVRPDADSPRSSDRPGTPRVMAVCTCHNKAILPAVSLSDAVATADAL